ncbi:MAG: DNA topoisomerase IB, partial [Candidatus Paceibacterota bacterium]
NQKHKFDQMVRFGEILPTLRQTVAGHMRQHQLSKQRILATVVWLLEHTFIRVGNKTYEKENQSYGLTTLRNKHVAVRGDKIKFSFKGKSGVYHELDISHPRVAQTVKECIELPGYELFQYLDENQQRQRVDSRDVNEYLQELTGEALSAKDFRTWGGTTLAGDLFYQLDQEDQEKEQQQVITEVVEQVADHLGNTTQVCRKYYIHPKIITSYERGKLQPQFKKVYARYKSKGLSPGEKATWLLLSS